MAWKKVITSGDNIGDIANVSSTAPDYDQILTWDGTSWVPADPGASFIFTTSGSSMTPSGMQLMKRNAASDNIATVAGSLEWLVKTENGPAVSGVALGLTGQGFPAGGEPFTSFGWNLSYDMRLDNTNDMPYPSGSGGTYQTFGWRHIFSADDILNAAGEEVQSSQAHVIEYANYVKWGKVDVNTEPSSSTIMGLEQASITNITGHGLSYGQAIGWAGVDIGVGEYFCFAVPKRIGEDKSLKLLVAEGMQTLDIVNEVPYEVSVVNHNDGITATDNYTELYSVYISSATNLGDGFELKTYELN